MIPVVLCGGSGTRLWPVSRAAHPKQFVDLTGGGTLLAQTLRRLAPLGPPRVVAVAGSEALVAAAVAEAAVETGPALFEPAGRNTAPAVALACHRLLAEGRGGEVVGVFPADHLIADAARLLAAVRLAARCARGDRVVTIGIRPTRPATGLGYIETSDHVVARAEPDGGVPALEARRAVGFHEKPDPATAERYLAHGGYLWNAGMFVFGVAAMAACFERLMPELWRRIRTVEPDLSNLAAVYAGIAPESLDYGLMERLEEFVAVPCDPGWSDLGSWDEVARVRPSDPAFEVGGRGTGGERAGGPGDGGGDRATSAGATPATNYIFGRPDRVYGLVGVEGLIVADTADALLVARRGTTERVKELVAELAAAGRPEAAVHPFEVRPWGSFEVLRDTERFKSKLLRVAPGHRLSYQSHRRRSEHWVVVAGRPRVVLDGEARDLGPGDHAFIPAGAKHRIENPGAEPVEIVEVQLGDYFGEDDIERYEDDYDRVPGGGG
jgi:mannose-1-phosphate guanylyltransferase/mannose-1-phosphate guanylyltransferase/mannose-6-phosphate isomerase